MSEKNSKNTKKNSGKLKETTAKPGNQKDKTNAESPVFELDEQKRIRAAFTDRIDHPGSDL